MEKQGGRCKDGLTDRDAGRMTNYTQGRSTAASYFSTVCWRPAEVFPVLVVFPNDY